MGSSSSSLTHSTVMAGLVRNCSRLLAKSGGVSSNSVRLMSGEAHEGGYKVWKNATFAICLPIIILANVNAFYFADHPKRRVPALRSPEDQNKEISLGRWQPQLLPQPRDERP